MTASFCEIETDAENKEVRLIFKKEGFLFNSVIKMTLTVDAVESLIAEIQEAIHSMEENDDEYDKLF